MTNVVTHDEQLPRSKADKKEARAITDLEHVSDDPADCVSRLKEFCDKTHLVVEYVDGGTYFRKPR